VTLTPGLVIPLRLNTPVWSDKSRIGDPVEAVVTAPVVKGSQVLLSPGTKLDGSVLFAQKAADAYSRPRLVLDISNIVHGDSTRSPLYTRVLAVDNAREMVENNEICGIIQPHASRTMSIAMTAVGIANPAASHAVQGLRTAYGASLRREIAFPVGTDFTIQVIQPSILKRKDPWREWPVLAIKERLRRLVQEAPLRTEAAHQIPSDLTNVLFIGTREELEAAFRAAGWKSADDLRLKSALEELQAAARKSGYDQAPASLLTLNGTPPDMVFQKALNTISKRHHVRIWKQSGILYEDRETWVAAATTGMELSVTSETKPSAPSGLYTRKQGQYLAFISNYRKLNGRAPAEVEIQRFFRVSPPSVHQMILTLEKRGLIRREPGRARSISVLVPEQQVPTLKASV
jgi:hypothetical protein